TEQPLHGTATAQKERAVTRPPRRPPGPPRRAALAATWLLAVPAVALALASGPAPSAAAAPVSAPGAASPLGASRATLPLGAPRAAAPGPQRFGVQPAGPAKPDARSRFTYSVTPGATLVDHLAVRNYSAGPLRLKVYASDAFNTPDGGFDLLTAGKRSTGVGAWVVSDVAQVVVPSKGTAIVPFQLSVPANATPGDHIGGIVAALRTIRNAGNGKKVTIEDRVGARIYLRVAGALHGALRVEDLRAGYDGTVNPFGHGRVTVNYVIHNVGNVRLSGPRPVRSPAGFAQA